MIWFLIGFVIWAVVHSVTAASSTKQAFRTRFGERAYQGLYRLLYNVVSVVSFLPILYILWTQIPQVTLWTIPAPWRYISMGIQLLALVGLAISLLQTDIWSFVGLRQAARFLQGAADPSVPDKFVKTGTYRWVRHPLYFFSLLFIWLNPVMMLGSFLFNVLATLYFWIGSIYEEKRLLAAFGEAYEEYKRSVPGLVPIRILSRNTI
jgi:protein-S-isoprenylcysteine O-methyltransferase Ste14